ncbi:hypothetical protein MN116_006046 [Schistosoma mekongi]|uniref:ATP-dependent helicase ATRX n=1 Tax=Schistosoma mekongi TaxID=38744 RepID=A0AAE2D3W1_SCHME|nr:hypothetical protein MN116_006046 [Schistosoma mekongi]
MRKKPSVTKCQIDEDKSSSEIFNNVPSECDGTHSDADSDVVQISPLFLMDSTGRPVLQDGTPVVEPEFVDSVSDTYGRNEKSHLSKISSSFSPGVMDFIKCTACCCKLQPFTMPFSVHPILKVILCKRCTKYSESQNFAKDDAGKDDNCKWCSDGGDLVCCDTCSCAICKKCIKQNLGRTYLRKVESLNESDTWNCFVCDPTPIKTLQDNCSEIVAKVEEYEAIRKRRSMKAQENWRSRSKGQCNESNGTGEPDSSTSHANLNNVLEDSIPNNILNKEIVSQVPNIQSNGVNISETNKYDKVNASSVINDHIQLATSESIDLHDIFNQISSVNETNIKTALRASQRCLDTFARDIRRLENSLMRNPPEVDLHKIGQSFQGIYKFHLFTRLGNLVTRMQEEEDIIKTTPIISKQTVPSQPIRILPKLNNVTSVPLPVSTISSSDVTIDLTKEDNATGNISVPEVLEQKTVLLNLPSEAFPAPIYLQQPTSVTPASRNGNNEDNYTTITITTSDNIIKHKLEEVGIEGQADTGKRCKLDIVGESAVGNHGSELSHENLLDQELEKEVHNLERICAKSINCCLTEQSNVIDERECVEANSNPGKQKKSIQNDGNKSANQRTNRQAKITKKNPVEFEDDSWSIEDNLNSSQNNADATFDSSESNDLPNDEDDDIDNSNVYLSRQNQLETKTIDYLHNLTARDDILKPSSDDDDVADRVLDSINTKAADSYNNNNASISSAEFDGDLKDDSASNNYNSSAESSNDDFNKNKSMCVNLKRNMGPSDPVVCLTRLAKALVNENVSSPEKTEYLRRSLPDDVDEEDESESNSNKDAVDLQVSSNSHNAKRMRHLFCSSDSDGNSAVAVGDECESEQSTASNSSKSSVYDRRTRKIKQNTTLSARSKRPLKRPSVKPTSFLSDDDDNDDNNHKKAKHKEVEDMKKNDRDTSSSTDEVENVAPRRKSCNTKRRRRLHKAKSDDTDDDVVQEKHLKGNKGKEPIYEELNDDTLDAKGRKKIRRIYTANRLSETTKAAEASEQERRRRLAERQKMYNEFIVKDGEGINAVTTKLILDPGDPIIEVHPAIVKHLKPHQVEAVRFLWDCTIESVELQTSCSESTSSAGSGAILAHCMGLGKTLSVISFLHTLLRYPEQINIRTCLIICPVNTLLNWKHEWDMWLPEDEPVDVFELASKTGNRLKLDIVKHWHTSGGVLLIGYDMFRNFIMTLMKRTRSKDVKNTLSSALLNPGPDIVVCDEGHLMKNAKSHIAKAVSQIRTMKRIILTGTPLQNNLNEYHTMVDFVKPNLLGTLKEFNNRFVNPIKNGQHSNSTPRDVNIMKKRAHILYKTLDGCVQRKDYSVLTKYLPPRYEYVIMCRLTKVQQELYSYFLENLDNMGSNNSSNNQDETSNRKTLFMVQQTLYRISTHPHALRIHETREARKMLLMDEDNFIDDSANSSESSNNSISSGDSDDDNDKRKNDNEFDEDSEHGKSSNNITNSSNINNTSPASRPRRRHRPMTRQESKNPTVIIDSDDDHDDDDSESVIKLGESQKPWWYMFYKDEYDWQINVGAKMDVLFNILKRCSDIGDKVIMFSHSLISLDLVEKFLTEINRQWSVYQNQTSNVKGSDNSESLQNPELLNRPDLSAYFSDIGHNTWVRGLDYERMDGSMNINTRKDLQARFNSTSNTRLRLFIISTKAGGLGINLISANRLILLDASWNPSHDIQSIFRSYRFGQSKPVYIYRLIAQGTIEEKIYDRQVTKQSLSLRVIDELQIGRHFSDADLQELFTFEPDIWNPEGNDKRPTPILPKDRLLADMLTEYAHLIVTYHNHDSLLEHREDEGLTESERQEAWREFEEEKRLGMSLAQHQRLLLQQEWLAQHQQLQQQQQLQLQYLQQQQQQQQFQFQQRLAMPHFANPNFRFPIIPSSNAEPTIIISDDNSNPVQSSTTDNYCSNINHDMHTLPALSFAGNASNVGSFTTCANSVSGIPVTASSVGSTSTIINISGSSIEDLQTALPQGINSSSSLTVHSSRTPQPRYVTQPVTSLPSNAYGALYSEVRRNVMLKDPSLASNPEKLDKLTLNRLLNALTTPVLISSNDTVMRNPTTFPLRNKTSQIYPQSKN